LLRENPAKPGLEENLSQLKTLLDRGLITRDDYEGKKQELLDSL